MAVGPVQPHKRGDVASSIADLRRNAIAAVIYVATAIVASVLVFRVLSAIDYSSDEFDRHEIWIFRVGIAACAVAGGVCVKGWRHPDRAFSRVVRVPAIVLSVSLGPWFMPVPFGAHEPVLAMVVLVAAGLLGSAARMPVRDCLAQRTVVREQVWLSGLMAFAAFAAVTGALAMWTIHALVFAALME